MGCRGSVSYRCEVTSVVGFVQQVACSYLRHDYWWYITSVIPKQKDAGAVDRKLIEKYRIDISEWRRARNKQRGRANLQYLRHDRFFAIFATQGQHEYYQEEGGQVRCIRRVPLRYAGYSISYRPGGRTRKGESDPRWHSHVQMDRERYMEMKAWFEQYASRRKADWLGECLSRIPYEPYAPVRRQQLNILRAVNRRRKKAGMDQIPTSVLRTRRRIVRPYD